MILAIDIGNTNMEFGIFDDKKMMDSFRLGTNRDITSDEVGLMISQFFMINNIDRKAIDDIVITSVVPQVMYSINNAIKKYFYRKKPYVVGDNLKIDIINLYNNPSEVGADRLVNAVAVLEKYGGPAIVVDFGTATTFDAINKEGAYIGGAIYPGIKISMEALFQNTAKLPRIELTNPGVIIGKSTIISMQAGAIYGYVGVVKNITSEMCKELGQDTKIIGTGGFSKLIGKETNLFHAIDRTLTLDGLKLIYDRQQR